MSVDVDARLEHRRETAHPAADLEAIVVHYADGPDRCTVSPPDPAIDERVTAWLTADVDAFVDLRETR